MLIYWALLNFCFTFIKKSYENGCIKYNKCFYKHVERFRNKKCEVDIMLDMMETEMRTNDLHFAEVNLTIANAAILLEDADK